MAFKQEDSGKNFLVDREPSMTHQQQISQHHHTVKREKIKHSSFASYAGDCLQVGITFRSLFSV